LNLTDVHAKVGIVDDDKSVRTVLLRLIRSAGFDALSFVSARQFLNDSRNEAVDCAVADVRMPDLSGLELLAELKRSARDLPVILISENGDVPTAVRAMKAGAVDFLEKPVDGQALLAAIATAAGRSQQLQARRAKLEDIEERYDTLTPREREVFALVTSGLTNKQVGRQLGIAEKTIKVHRSRVMDKMGAQSLADLVRMADRLAAALQVDRKDQGSVRAFAPPLAVNSVLLLGSGAAGQRAVCARPVTSRLRLHRARVCPRHRTLFEVSRRDLHQAIAPCAELTLEQPVASLNLTVETQPAK
jgi:RNA polymerase sigma factor (sigma-70 family)